jgi:hypothetical protein
MCNVSVFVLPKTTLLIEANLFLLDKLPISAKFQAYHKCNAIAMHISKSLWQTGVVTKLNNDASNSAKIMTCSKPKHN